MEGSVLKKLSSTPSFLSMSINCMMLPWACMTLSWCCWWLKCHRRYNAFCVISLCDITVLLPRIPRSISHSLTNCAKWTLIIRDILLTVICIATLKLSLISASVVVNHCEGAKCFSLFTAHM